MIAMHPSFLFFIAGLLVLLVPPIARKAIQLATPVFAFLLLQGFIAYADIGPWTWSFFGFEFSLVQIDPLALLFVYVFLLFAFLSNLYGLHATDKNVPAASNFYVGSSIGAVLAGDLVTLFIFWEIMALSSALLIWNRDRKSSLGALFRYLLVHLTGGLFFFSGILLKLFTRSPIGMDALAFDLAGWLIFISFLINAGIPPLHAWLPDAYPEGTPHGSIYLSAFTTKVAVYAFARGFAGAEILIWLGALAAVYGVVYALMENDMRRLLSYHIVCQVGYMICGIGIGSHLGINAGTGHAVGNILFKGLLFMATGALIHMTGKYKLSDLGGMARKDKWVLLFYMIGALAISGMPLLNGYVTKSLLLEAASHEHLGWLELTLLWVAVGTFLSIALKLAYFAFWGESEGPKTIRKVPLNMHLAMAGTSLVCLAIGIFPDNFFAFLPYEVHAQSYTLGHVIPTLELLVATVLGFLLILKFLHTKDVISLDTDWFYRKGAYAFLDGLCYPIRRLQEWIQVTWTISLEKTNERLRRSFPHQDITAVGTPLLWMMLASLIVGIAVFAAL
ncbi:MAG: Na(+)/H(+) antiporter subunit D [Candidatus Omnitrophica bacterium]|nr:Na(+)/H(+) antiporter subunit D [Candidatus Omnitrophota bacterium]